MWERSSDSVLQRTQSSPTWKALFVRTSCQTPPSEAFKALRKLSSARLAQRFRCLKLCVLSPKIRSRSSDIS
eukprot:2392485-Amphidinium_carterae.1